MPEDPGSLLEANKESPQGSPMPTLLSKATDTAQHRDLIASPTPPPWGLLRSLPVDVSAVLAAGPLLYDQRTFTGFGMPKGGSAEEFSPQWEFAVPPGTRALAPVTGYVVGIQTLWSDDLSVWISADREYSWVWEVEHVVDVQVRIGDAVEAGQAIAIASVFGGRSTGLVELGLLQGGQAPAHYCPLLYVDKEAMPSIEKDLAEIRKENFDRLGKQDKISDLVNDPDGQSCWTDHPIGDGS
ncbi:M23 family metallopeptidase [Dehalococcoidia bacterium]|nr:M23 family metallopeptidase [Dehalococcoidia bacterium]